MSEEVDRCLLIVRIKRETDVEKRVRDKVYNTIIERTLLWLLVDVHSIQVFHSVGGFLVNILIEWIMGQCSRIGRDSRCPSWIKCTQQLKVPDSLMLTRNQNDIENPAMKTTRRGIWSFNYLFDFSRMKQATCDMNFHKSDHKSSWTWTKIEIENISSFYNVSVGTVSAKWNIRCEFRIYLCWSSAVSVKLFRLN